jgi:copper chaperone CopZ
MKTTIIVEGMKCRHCEVHAEEALLKIPSVSEAKADRISREIVITSSEPLSEEALKSAIESVHYTYKGIRK